jgi:Aminoglycoside-2''-adenylyltransferase
MSQQFEGEFVLDDQTRSQLKILGEINAIFSSLQARSWLRGGWAIDFLLGQITRTHSDIDLVTWVLHRGQLEQALVDAGFKYVPVSEFQTDFLKDDIDISFVYLSRAKDGRIIANGIPKWVWRSDALPTKRFNLHGISALVLSPHQLLENLQIYEQGTGRKLRPKDIESIKVIRRIIESH